jgi:hypothetical protein
MKKHWRAITRTPHRTLYVTTADSTTRAQENRGVVPGLDAAHRRLALEAFGDYVLSRGVQLVGPPQQLESTPANLAEVAWLREFASKHSPYSLSATVYEDFEE